MAEKMERHGVRYVFEHRLLPNWFYEDKDKLVGAILHDKSILFRIISDVFKEENVENPYKEEDFDAHPFKVTEEVRGLCVEMPEPEEEPLCYRVYMIFNTDFDKLWFFTIEKGNEAGENYPFVCAWDAEGSHLNLGHCSFDKNNALIRCLDIFMEIEYGLVRNTEEELEEFKEEERARKKKYDDFMAMCHEKYPEFFEATRFPEHQERTEYLLLYLYNRSRIEGSKKIVCTKEEMLEYYWDVVDSKSLSRNLATLEKNCYIDRTVVKDESGKNIGNEYYLRM